MIDVIIPVYNVEKYLDKCIQSVLKQNYVDFEMILVDDGSTDNSGKICDTYSLKDERIKVIHKTNGGLSSARNAGLDISTGEYILFLDSDDTLCENALQVLYDAISESGADSVFGGYCSVDELNNVTSVLTFNECILSGDARFNLIYKFTFANMTCGKLYKRKLFDSVRFPEGKLHEDVFVYHQLAYNAETIYCINTPILNYLQREDSIMGKKFTYKNYHAVDALFERVLFLKEKKLEKAAAQAIDYIFKYLLYIIHKIDFSNAELSNLFDQYYNQWKKLSGQNHDRAIRYIKFAYRHKIIRGSLFSSYLMRVARKVRMVISARYIIARIFCCYFHIKPNYILISTPIHGNLGDQAIVYAQKMFLSDNGIKHILEINNIDYLKNKEVLGKLVRKKDVIIVDGGGNLGTLWPTEADRINDIVVRFRSNKVIIFPETAYFSDDFSGKLSFKTTQEAFCSNKNLNVFLRDEPSYDIIKQMLPTGNVFLCPDIVMYLNKKMIVSNAERRGALLCLRTDKEKVIEKNFMSMITCNLKENKISFNKTDTVVNNLIYSENRKEELEKKISEFSKAKFVITDRLHGMIFAYITNTPCIAINNINKKVENQYRWIENLPGIILLNSEGDIEKAITQINEFKQDPLYTNIHELSYDNLKAAVCYDKKK